LLWELSMGLRKGERSMRRSRGIGVGGFLGGNEEGGGEVSPRERRTRPQVRE